MMNKQMQTRTKELIYDKLAQKENEKQIKEIGTVLTVKDGVVQIYGMKSVQAGEMVEFIGTNLLGLTLNLEKNSISVVLFGDDSKVAEGSKVKRTGELMSVAVGEGMCGRVVDASGNAID